MRHQHLLHALLLLAFLAFFAAGDTETVQLANGGVRARLMRTESEADGRSAAVELQEEESEEESDEEEEEEEEDEGENVVEVPEVAGAHQPPDPPSAEENTETSKTSTADSDADANGMASTKSKTKMKRAVKAKHAHKVHKGHHGRKRKQKLAFSQKQEDTGEAATNAESLKDSVESAKSLGSSSKEHHRHKHHRHRHEESGNETVSKEKQEEALGADRNGTIMRTGALAGQEALAADHNGTIMRTGALAGQALPEEDNRTHETPVRQHEGEDRPNHALNIDDGEGNKPQPKEKQPAKPAIADIQGYNRIHTDAARSKGIDTHSGSWMVDMARGKKFGSENPMLTDPKLQGKAAEVDSQGRVLHPAPEVVAHPENYWFPGGDYPKVPGPLPGEAIASKAPQSLVASSLADAAQSSALQKCIEKAEKIEQEVGLFDSPKKGKEAMVALNGAMKTMGLRLDSADTNFHSLWGAKDACEHLVAVDAKARGQVLLGTGTA